MSKNIYKEEFPIEFQNYMEGLIEYMENNPDDYVFEKEFFSTSRAQKYKQWKKDNKIKERKAFEWLETNPKGKIEDLPPFLKDQLNKTFDIAHKLKN